jgi:hypothetical protein
MVAFEIVIAVVCATSAVLAAVMFVRATRLYDKIGALGTLGMSHDNEQAVATREIVREEVRQMVDAISALREERGKPPLPPDLLRELDASAASREPRDRG